MYYLLRCNQVQLILSSHVNEGYVLLCFCFFSLVELSAPCANLRTFGALAEQLKGFTLESCCCKFIFMSSICIVASTDLHNNDDKCNIELF